MKEQIKKSITSLINNHEHNDDYMIFKAIPEVTAKYLQENDKGIISNKGKLINQGLLNLFIKINEIVFINSNQNLDLQFISNSYFSSYQTSDIVYNILLEIKN
jgi:hypothetical protein